MRVEYREEPCSSALNRVRGMPFAWSLNPYMGCAHRCTFCGNYTLTPQDRCSRIVLMAHRNELIEVFKAKAKPESRGCPWCDTNDWFVASGGDKFAALLLSNVEGIATSGALEALPITCKNCGYVQLHLTSVLEKEVH